MTLGSRHHAANLSLASWTLKSFSNGTPLTTRVQAHVPTCKTKSGLIKKWIFFPDKWLVAMVIFDMTAHPFSPFFTSDVTSLFCLHQSEARKIQHGRLFCLLQQSDLRGCVCKLNVKIPRRGLPYFLRRAPEREITDRISLMEYADRITDPSPDPPVPLLLSVYSQHAVSIC